MGYTGDWIISKFPTNSIISTKFIFKERTTLISRATAEWKCYGSKDGITLVEISQASQTVRLVSSNYVNGFYTKTFSNSTAYQYVGFTINKIVGGVNSDMVNFSELPLFGKEPTTPSINPVYISSDVLPNILQPYDTFVVRENAIIGLSNVYISSNNFFNGLIPNYATNITLSIFNICQVMLPIIYI